MFQNIGKKIKTLTLVLFWIQVVAYAITGFIFIIDGIDSYYGGDEEIITGLIIMIVGPLMAWIMSFLLYGFGEMIDKSADTARNTGILVAIAANQSPEAARIAQTYGQPPVYNQPYQQPYQPQAYAAPAYTQNYAQPAPQQPVYTQPAPQRPAQPVAPAQPQTQPAAPAQSAVEKAPEAK